MEQLEARALLTAVSWTGAAGDNLWHSPLNWSTSAVPTAADDVTIDLAATDPTILLTSASGTQAVNSLTTTEAIRFQGGSLTVGTFANFSKNLSLEGATLIGGVYTGSAGSRLTTSSSGGVLKDLTLNGELRLSTSQAKVALEGSTTFSIARLMATSVDLRLRPGYTLVNPVTSEGSASLTRFITLADGAPGTITVGTTGSIRLLTGGGAGLTIRQDQAATFVNNGLLSAELAAPNTLALSAASIINNGVMQTIGGVFSVSTPAGGSWTNAASGTINVTGGQFTLASAWTDAGSINITAGNLILGGAFATSGINFAAFAYSGGAVTLTGQLDNTGSTLALTTSTGSWTLSGGKITGGSLTRAGGVDLIASATQGELASVALDGKLTIGPSAKVLVSGTTSFSQVALNAGTLSMLVGYTLNANVNFDGASPGRGRLSVVASASPGAVTIAPGVAVQLGPTATASSILTIDVASGSTLINRGAIVLDAGAFSFSTGTFINIGTFSLGVGVTVTFTGTLDASGGLGDWHTGGSIFQLPNAIVELGGSTLTLNNNTGSWMLRSGTIRNGTIVFADGQQLVFDNLAGVLENITLPGDISLDNSRSLILQGNCSAHAIHLTSMSAKLVLDSGVLDAAVIVEGTDAGDRLIEIRGQAVLAPTSSIRIAPGAGGGLTISNSSNQLTNQGVIENLSATQNLRLSFGYFNTKPSFVNQGQVLATGGSIDIGAPFTNVTGTISAAPGTTLSISSFLYAGSGQGTITSNGGSIVLQGGGIDVTGGVFTLSDATGSITMINAQISGGTFQVTQSAQLIVTSYESRLSNVAFLSDILLNTDSAKVKISGTTTFPNLRLAAANTRATISAGVSISGRIVAEGPAAGARVISVFAETAAPSVVAPTGSIELAAGCGADLLFDISPGTLINNGLITNRAPGRTLSIALSAMTNNSTIEATTGTLSISAINWNNAASGTVRVTDASLITGGTWSNTGVISVIRSVADLAGKGTLAGLAASGGSTVNLIGELSNAGNTLSWHTSQGTLLLGDGTITGGSIVLTGGATLHCNGFSYGSLVDVAVTGDILLDTPGAIVAVSGSTVFSAVRLTESNTILRTGGAFTVSAPIIAEGPATGGRSIQFMGVTTIASGVEIMLAAGCGGNLALGGTSGSAVVSNDGVITCAAAGRTLTITGTFFENRGLVQAATGALSITSGFTNTAVGLLSATNVPLLIQGLLTNDGLLSVTNSAFTFQGSTESVSFTESHFSRTGGTVSIKGAITTGVLHLNPATGSFLLEGGTIQDATLRRTGGADLVFTSTGGFLQNVLVEGDLVLSANNTQVKVGGTTSFATARLSGNNVTLFLVTTYVLNNPVVVEGPNSGLREISLFRFGQGSGAVTIGNSGSLRVLPGSGGSLLITTTQTMALINNGLISVEQPGRAVNIQPRTFTNNGTLTADGGTIVLQPLTSVSNLTTVQTLSGGTWRALRGGTFTAPLIPNFSDLRTINATVELGGPTSTWNSFAKLQSITSTGSLTLSGGLSLAVAPVSGALTNSGLLTIGPGSTLAITGNYAQAAIATLQIQLAGAAPGTYGVLTATGTSSLAGTLNVSAVNGYQPQMFDVQNVVVSVGASTGTFASVTLPTPASNDAKILLSYTGHGVQILTTSRADVNNDGIIDAQDLFSFLNSFDSTSPGADLDGDGTVDLSDYFLFFNLFDQS